MLGRASTRDHTRGSLLASMFAVSLPLVLQSLAGGIAFQLVDLALLAQLGEDAVTAVVVSNQSLRQVAFMFAMGASFGAQGWVARAVGAGHSEEADHVAGQAMLLALFMSLLFAVLGVVYARPLLSSMNVSPAVLELAVPYTRITFALGFGFVVSTFFNAVLTGAGETTTPLLISIAQTVVALLGEWALMFGKFGLPALGVNGAAIGIALGQLVAVALASAVLFGGASRIRLRSRHLRPDRAVLGRIFSLGWPPALQMAGNFLVTLFFIRLMGQLGPASQAAYSIGLRISMLGPMLAFPLAGAASTLVGQNLGAGDRGRAWRALALGMACNAALLWSIGAAMVWFRADIMRSLASDPEVLRIGEEFLLYQAGAFGAWAFFFVFLRSLQGAGDVFVPMLLSLGSSLVYTLPLGYGLAIWADWGATGVFTATFSGSWISMLLMGAWVATGRWQHVTHRVSPASESAT